MNSVLCPRSGDEQNLPAAVRLQLDATHKGALFGAESHFEYSMQCELPEYSYKVRGSHFKNLEVGSISDLDTIVFCNKPISFRLPNPRATPLSTSFLFFDKRGFKITSTQLANKIKEKLKDSKVFIGINPNIPFLVHCNLPSKSFGYVEVEFIPAIKWKNEIYMCLERNQDAWFRSICEEKMWTVVRSLTAIGKLSPG